MWRSSLCGTFGTWCQFHQHFMSSFYTRRSQKRRKDTHVKQLFALLESACVKAAHKHVDEIDPCRTSFYWPGQSLKNQSPTGTWSSKGLEVLTLWYIWYLQCSTCYQIRQNFNFTSFDVHLHYHRSLMQKTSRWKLTTFNLAATIVMAGEIVPSIWVHI